MAEVWVVLKVWVVVRIWVVVKPRGGLYYREGWVLYLGGGVSWYGKMTGEI